MKEEVRSQKSEWKKKEYKRQNSGDGIKPLRIYSDF
jgi:hypothetical protein